MSSFVLSKTNAKMPAVGLGLWKIPKTTCADVVYNAIKLGYRLLDGAATTVTRRRLARVFVVPSKMVS